MKKILASLLVLSCSLLYAQHSEISLFRNTLRVGTADTSEEIVAKAAHIIPTSRQWEAQKNEFIAFVHFGPNTFTRMEWGTGKESPRIFDLQHLDTDQWCEAMKAAGMKMVILTVKHHDGFVLWQSRYTRHGIMSTDYQGGKGDVLKELSESCRKYGLKLGVYLSPADLYQIENPDGLYGNGSRPSLRTIPREVPGRPFKDKTRFEFEVDDYNEYFLNQLFELLTEYGPIHEVWFDGAHPKRKGGQKYNYKAWRELIRKLAPEATIFGREDIRWCGNEAGHTRESEWNVIAAYEEDPDIMEEFRDLYGDLGTREVLLTRERPYYLHYQPAETNTSIREGWFYRDDVNQRVRSADDVFDIYERAVGGNSIFLLNIPPNREGRFSVQDVEVLKEVGKRISETYGHDLLANAVGPREVLDDRPETYLLLNDSVKEMKFSFPRPVTLNRFVIQEAVDTHSERVEHHALYAGPFRMESGELQAVAWKEGEKGAVLRERFGLVKKNWSVLEANSGSTRHPASAAFDEQLDTYWAADSISPSTAFCVDLGRVGPITGFAYTPQQENKKGLVAGGYIEVSLDGKHWNKAGNFTFGNLINDPTKRYHYFPETVEGRYFRMVFTEIAGGDSSVSMAELDIYID